MKMVGNCSEVAEVFGKSKGWFYMHRNRLEQMGFPKRDKEIGGWSLNAVKGWIDSRSNISQANEVEQIALRIINGQSHV